MRRILYLAQAEVLHIVRDRTTLLQIIVVPVLQLLVLVHAATFVIPRTPMYVVDHDRSSTSRGLISRLVASGYFELAGRSPSAERGGEAVRDGRVAILLVIPPDLESALIRDGNARVQLILNGDRGSAAGIVASYAAGIIADHSRNVGGELLAHTSTPGGAWPGIVMRVRGWYNPFLDYRHYMVPGVLVALVTIIGTLLSAQNIAREKELGTLEQLNVTPISRGEFIAAKLLPLWVLGLLDLGIGLGVGKLVFDIPMRGSLMLLFFAAAVYLIGALAIGLLVSTVVDTQQQAMFVTFFILNIYLLLSGLFTPIDSMAPWVQVASEANPVRHFVTISRTILVKGGDLDSIARPLLALALFAIVTLALAVLRYRKRIA